MHAAVRTLLLATTLLWGLGASAHAAEFNDAQRKEMESIIKDYLLANPDILREMGQLLEQQERLAEDQQRKGALVANADKIFRDGTDFVAGNPDGKVTMVEFFDYNCGWCKKGFSEVMALIESDKDLRFVLKEFPIFGGDSDYAAQAAIAAGKQGKYWDLHVAMFSHEGKITKETVDELAAAQGLDMAQLKKTWRVRRRPPCWSATAPSPSRLPSMARRLSLLMTSWFPATCPKPNWSAPLTMSGRKAAVHSADAGRFPARH